MKSAGGRIIPERRDSSVGNFTVFGQVNGAGNSNDLDISGNRKSMHYGEVCFLDIKHTF